MTRNSNVMMAMDGGIYFTCTWHQQQQQNYPHVSIASNHKATINKTTTKFSNAESFQIDTTEKVFSALVTHSEKF